jgi:DNA-binding transcriptional regulator YhcF (GntR family)
LRFWITKNSEVSIREQLVGQLILAILSEDLKVGQKLPSIRALARRHQIHSNTVSAAYHHLLGEGWLELRSGSGLYVRPRQPSGNGSDHLDTLLTGALSVARARGHEPEAVLRRLEQLIHPRRCERVVIAEADAGMREILLAEVGEHTRMPVEAIETPGSVPDGSLVVALPTRAATVQERLERGTPFLILRLNSVQSSLEIQQRPAPNAILSIVSRSIEFRRWARTILVAVGFEPDCLNEIDTALDDWRGRACAGTLAITDFVAAAQLPERCEARVFRMIADASIAEIKRMCGD